MNWKDQRREDVFHFLMVDPHNLDVIRGEIDNIILSDCSLTYGYDTDTRVSGKVKFLEENFIENSWIRIVHEVRKENYFNELGTFIAVNPSVKTINGTNEVTYDLQSVLWTLKSDLCPYHFAIGQGAYSLDAFDRVCDTCHRPFVHKATAVDYIYTSSKVYEMGSSYLDILFDISNISGNRVEVDGHGRITIEGYSNPAYLATSWDLNADDSRSVIINEGISKSSTDYDTPNRAIIIYQNNDTEIYAYSDAPSEFKFSQSQRGYVMAEVYQMNDMSPATKERAQTLSEQYLEENLTGVTEYSLTSAYFPAKPGETLNLTYGGANHHCLITAIDSVNLKEMTMDLTVKEV